MEQLENAAKIVMSAGGDVSQEQRKEAEQIFLQLRNTRNPFNLCRQILETTKTEYLLFEAATLLRLGIIREWSILSEDDISQLRQYILHYLMNNTTKPTFLREILSQVVGIMVKRHNVGESCKDRARFLDEVEQLMQMSDNNLRLLGCSIISALMQEYGVTIRSADVGLMWETHFNAKRQFEGTDLRRIFYFICKLLEEMLNIDTKVSQDLSELLYKLISISENILTWSFISYSLPKRLMSVFEQDQNPSLRPSEHWKETFLTHSIVPLFFKLYWKVRGEWEMSYHALNCLTQLASLNGVVLNNRETRVKYLAQYLECLFAFLDSTELKEEEALGFSNIFRKLLLFFPQSILVELPENIFERLIFHLSNFTCKFVEGAALEISLDQEDQMYMEAFEQMLQSWSCVLHDSDLQNGSKIALLVKHNSIMIFDTYLKCHLSPPYGTRQPESEDCEITDVVQSDRIAFRDQLCVIGLCGRQTAEHGVSVLTRLLEDLVEKLRSTLGQAALNKDMSLNDNSAVMTNLYEDIHWLLLTAGHVTTMDNEGETALIPAELVNLSIAFASNCDVETTMTLLAQPDKSANDIPNVDKADPIVRFISAIFRLCETELQALSVNLGHLLSPEVSGSLMWFLRRFCLTYLLPDEAFYSELSVCLTTCFGRDSNGAVWTLTYLLKMVEKTLRFRCNEPALVQDTVNLLVTLSDSKERGALLIKSEGFMALMKLQQSQNFTALTSTAQRGLTQSLVMCGSAIRDVEMKTQFWKHTLDPICERFNQLILSPSFQKNFHEDNVKQRILSYIDNFVGMVDGCLMSTSHVVFGRLVVVMENCVRLMDVYHNYTIIIEAILELYVACGRRMLCFLKPSDSKRLYNASVDLVRIYAKHNSGKRILDAHLSEEDQWRDLQLLIELLTSLLSKDFIDLAPFEHGEDTSDNVAGTDVCLFGLNIIMPLISKELLLIPSVCSQYFKMIAFVAEIHPSKICQLNEDLFNNLLYSIELGLTSFGTDIGTLSFDFLVVLGTHMFKNFSPDSIIRQKIRPFLKLVLDLILSHQVNSDLLQTASSALYTLICCFQSDYQDLVSALLQCQSDPETGRRLAKSFTELTNDIKLRADRTNRSKFRNNFEKFIANVRGFLLVK